MTVRRVTTEKGDKGYAVSVNPSRLPLTAIESHVYALIEGALVDSGMAPTIRELARFTGRTFPRVHQVLVRLEAKGWIAREKHKARAIKILGVA